MIALALEGSQTRTTSDPLLDAMELLWRMESGISSRRPDLAVEELERVRAYISEMGSIRAKIAREILDLVEGVLLESIIAEIHETSRKSVQ